MNQTGILGFSVFFSANHFSKSPKWSLFLRKNEINQNKQLSGAISNCLTSCNCVGVSSDCKIAQPLNT